MTPTIMELNITKSLTEAFEANCAASNEISAFYKGQYDIPQDNIDAIIASINNAEDLCRAIYSSTHSYKSTINSASIRSVIMKRCGVENAAAEAALKAALADVLGI